MTYRQNNYASPFFVGVDVGGTNIKIGIVDEHGATVAEARFPTQPAQPSRLAFEQVKRELDRMLAGADLELSDIEAVGLGTPGPLDIQSGQLLTPTNLPGWHHSPVQGELSEILGKPVTFANDACAAAYGEFWVGSGKRYDSMVMLTLGTGVGGGIIVGDLSIDGSHSHGAELGHITIDTSPDARICGCGQKGHLEAYASASALVERTREAMAEVSALENPSILIGQTNDDSPLTALKISNAAKQGDELAMRMIRETATYLGQGIAILSHVVDPEVFILGGAMNFGGGASAEGKKFLNDIVDTAKELVFPVIAENMVVKFAELGSDAGYSGAAGLARHQFIHRNLTREVG